MQTVSNPLLIEDISEGSGVVKRGFSTQYQIRIRNLTSQKTEVQVWIDPTDDRSEAVWQWCRFSESNLLTLQGDSSEEVTLTFDVPSLAKPGVYNYEIRVEAPIEYPGKVIGRPQQLRVQPAEQDTEWDNIPVFKLQPPTTSANPYPLSAGDRLEITIQIENRSKLVDRFSLLCPDYPQSWYTVRYPESLVGAAGPVQATDGLQLNPGKSGEIQLILHPPRYTPAGRYCPTVRLISDISDELTLLDAVYLQLLPDDRLTVDLLPEVRSIPKEFGIFTIAVLNEGNIQRDLTFYARDQDQLFTYIVDPSDTRVLPGEKRYLQVIARPPQWWRTLQRKRLDLPFAVTVENLLHQAPSETLPKRDEPEFLVEPVSTEVISSAPVFEPALPNNLQGKIIWQPNPWLLMWLLLLALGLLGLIAFLLWKYFHQAPPPTPEIIQFKATESQYQEGRNTPIRLGWQVSQLDRIQSITITRLDGGVEAYRKTYYFNVKENGALTGIPSPLQQQLGTNLPKDNNYCVEKAGNERTGDILSCPVMLTPTSQAGDYIFKIEVFTRSNAQASANAPQNPQAAVTKVTDTIAIQSPEPIPVIMDFASTAPLYVIPSSNPQALSKTSSQAPGTPSSVPPAPPVMLNWAIANPQQIRELALVGIAADGTISSPLRRYSFTQGVPPELQQFCTLATILTCQGVPTSVQTYGEYTFQLRVTPVRVPMGEPTPAPIVAMTATIKVQPPLPEIKSFTVNGQNIENQPKLTYTLSRQRSPFFLNISWDTQDGEAQLLPAPGVIDPASSLLFPVSVPSQTTLTLQVTNAAGQQDSRTVLIEVIEFALPPQSQAPSSESSSDILPPPPPSPINGDGKVPLELPPRPD